MQLDVGSEPHLSTAQALCLIISNTFYYKSFANGQRITAMAKSENLHLSLTGIPGKLRDWSFNMGGGGPGRKWGGLRKIRLGKNTFREKYF